MKKDTIFLLVTKYQNRIIGALLATQEIELIDKDSTYKWSNVKISNKGMLNMSNVIQPAASDLVDDFRSHFPPRYKSSKSEVAVKLARFMEEHPQYTKEQIIECSRLHNEHSTPPYCGKAGLFIYKKPPGEEEFSRILEYLEDEKESNSGTLSMEI